MQELVKGLEVHPVFTAHPTEARRRAVVTAIRRVGDQLELPQAVVVKDRLQGAPGLAQVLLQPLHRRRIAGPIAFLKLPWKISRTNSVR